MERTYQIWKAWEVKSKHHWTVHSSLKNWKSRVQTGVASRNRRYSYTFHVYYLRKFTREDPYMIPLLELRIDENKKLIEEHEAIIDQKTKKLRGTIVELVLV